MAAVSLAMPMKLWESVGWERGRTFLYLLVLAMGAAVRSLAAPGCSWASVEAAWGSNERITDSPWASVCAAGMSILNSQISLLTHQHSTFALHYGQPLGAIVHSWDVHHQSVIILRFKPSGSQCVFKQAWQKACRQQTKPHRCLHQSNCVRRSISVSHNMARLPVWSLRVRATWHIPTGRSRRQLHISYPLVFFPPLLAFLLFCLPVRTCTSSVFEASERPEMYSEETDWGNLIPSFRHACESACSAVVNWQISTAVARFLPSCFLSSSPCFSFLLTGADMY